MRARVSHKEPIIARERSRELNEVGSYNVMTILTITTLARTKIMIMTKAMKNDDKICQEEVVEKAKK